MLAEALSRHGAVSVRATVAEYVRRTPTKSEMTAAGRAAHRSVERGQARVLHVPRAESDSGPGGQYLILVRPGTTVANVSWIPSPLRAPMSPGVGAGALSRQPSPETSPNPLSC
jgi:hypothetical protein